MARTKRNARRRVLEEYRDDLFGIPVILRNAVVVEIDQAGDETYAIPDEQGLSAAIAVTRCLISRKLTGREIRFMRKALGMTQKELAERMDVDPATASRWENGSQVLGGAAEKVLRHLVCDTLHEKAPAIDYDPRAISYMTVEVAADAAQRRKDEPLVFTRVPLKIAGRKTIEWDNELPTADSIASSDAR